MHLIIRLVIPFGPVNGYVRLENLLSFQLRDLVRLPGRSRENFDAGYVDLYPPMLDPPILHLVLPLPTTPAIIRRRALRLAREDAYTCQTGEV